MSRHVPTMVLLTAFALLPVAASSADEPLHARIDALVAAAAKGRPASPPVDDAGFVRRVTLDLTGSIPTAAETLAFLEDPSTEKRARWIDALLDGPGYPRRMQELVHVMFMERLGDHAAWSK